jgi:hypothetical protein
MQQPDGSSSSGPLLKFDVPSSTEQTVSQINCLLRVVEQVGAFTLEDNDPVEGSENDEEVKKKSADTVVQALHQLDNLLNDASRWCVQRSEAELAHVRHIEGSSRLQDLVAREARRPFRRLQAEVGQLKDGRGWVACLQQAGLHPLMAAGTTPDKAMLAFDRLVEEGFETYDLLTQTPYFDGIPPAKTKKRKKPSA